jgi:hypothetical protein
LLSAFLFPQLLDAFGVGALLQISCTSALQQAWQKTGSIVCAHKLDDYNTQCSVKLFSMECVFLDNGYVKRRTQPIIIKFDIKK